jgi:hypothetical protein
VPRRARLCLEIECRGQKGGETMPAVLLIPQRGFDRRARHPHGQPHMSKIWVPCSLTLSGVATSFRGHLVAKSPHLATMAWLQASIFGCGGAAGPGRSGPLGNRFLEIPTHLIHNHAIRVVTRYISCVSPAGKSRIQVTMQGSGHYASLSFLNT